ncbi:nucleoside-diphosphate-sugar epimerase [Prauserella shujinwangii]|uniref:Nucleoside-diphosphate-sugar epimerase n=1 Tax=Prauserella shujinwangii TaxID=1453103 RepID=A0A2T0M3X4_9PSEU|nr:NAD(P)-dependent oxidoreductase [Prauserella shujinwangii]PRX51454.1 nucleoside-diphosphate-sugar epimerase [Prauserella shujinwangii]
MKVFVTGATGAIGGHTVPALVRAGHTVSALARGSAKAEVLAEQGATPVPVSLFDRDALAAAFAGHDAVVNLATAMPATAAFVVRRAWRPTGRVRAEGAANVADAALAAGVRRVVQESVAMLYRDHGAQWIDEDAAVDSYPATAGNHAAEAAAHRFTAFGGEGTVLRFGLFYGPGARHSEQMLALARRHIGVMLGPPGSYLSSIHVADAASAVVAALHAPAGTFNVVDDEPLTQRAYAGALSHAAGATPWLRVPGRAGLLLGDRLTSLTRSLRVSNSRFRDATAWAPAYPSAREGWLATAAHLDRAR